MLAPNSGPGVLLRGREGFVGRISRALRVIGVCRSNVYTESGEKCRLTVGVDGWFPFVSEKIG